MMFTNKAYNALKFIALVVLPGASAAYFGLSQIWGLPNTEKVIGTITILDTLLGLILKNSTANYIKNGKDSAGELIITDVDGERYLSLGVNRKDLDVLATKDEVTLSVVHKEEPPR